MARVQEEARRRVGRAVDAAMGEQQLSVVRLAGLADVDEKTLRSLIAGDRWPQAGTRGRLEEALGWKVGRMQQIADGGAVDDEKDPVVAAIELSRLTRANQHKLIGSYYQMLDDQQEMKGA